MSVHFGGYRVVAICTVALAAASCKSSGQNAEAAHGSGVVDSAIVKAAPADPDAVLREQFHAAAYQIDQALDHLAMATESLQPLPAGEAGETKKALVDLLAAFDKAGRRLNDGNAVPELADVRKDRSAAQLKIGKRRDDLKQSISELKATQSTLDDMLASSPPDKEKIPIESAAQAIDESLGFLNQALDVLN